MNSKLWQDSAESSKEALVQGLKNAVSDADAMLSNVAIASMEEVSVLSSKIEDKLCALGGQLENAGSAALETAREAADASRQYVMKNPWKSVAFAATGILIGVLIHRSRSH